MTTLSLKLPVLLPSGPECERCTDRLRTELSRIKGVQSASVDPSRTTVTLQFDPDMVTVSRIEMEAKNAGATITAAIEHRTLELRDLDCPDCASTIEKAVQNLPGVLWARANFAAGQMQTEYQRGRTELADIRRVVESHGARTCAIGHGCVDEAREEHQIGTAARWLSENRKLASTIAGSALTVIGAALAAAGMHRPADLLFAAGILAGGWSTARAAVMSIRARAIDMNVLMTLAVVGAAAIGDWFEGATVVALYNIGVMLQTFTVEKTRRSIRGLISLQPKAARVRRDMEIDLPVEQVEAGDIVIVRPGERIPIDGEVVLGSSSVNQAPITGESVPIEKERGSQVFAGSLNMNGSLEVRAAHPFKETTIARIVHLVEEAQTRRAPAQEFVDRFAARYTPIVVTMAVVIAFGPWLWSIVQSRAAHPIPSGWLLKALSMLIIACPCALVISIPVAVVAAIGAASRNGVLIKGGAFLERVGRIKAMLYDKTGTLTRGKFEVDQVIPVNGAGAEELLSCAAAIEAQSEHPLARAIVDRRAKLSEPLPVVEAFLAMPGLGARARLNGRTYTVGNQKLMESRGIDVAPIGERLQELEAGGRTVVIVADEDRPIGLITLYDVVRPEAESAVAAMRSLGVPVHAMLTGDHERSALAAARDTGVDEVRADLLPAQKLELVREYQARYGTVAMIGDGINDAPALAAADVGIVMGAAGSDTAIETADVALMSDDLTRLPYLVTLGRRANAIVIQNVGFSLFTKAALLVAAVTTGLPLWLAVVGDVGVSLAVTLNALRLLRTNPRAISVV